MTKVSIELNQFDDWGKAVGTKTVELTRSEIAAVVGRAAQLIAVHCAVRRSSGDLEGPLDELRVAMECCEVEAMQQHKHKPKSPGMSL